MTATTRLDSDLVVVGGGLVGASLALAAAQAGISSTVIESQRADDRDHRSFDERTIALTFTSMRIFRGLRIWDGIADQACPINDIHVSDRGHAGMAVLDRSLVETEALGYVVPTRALGAALAGALDDNPLVRHLCPSNAVDAWTDDDHAGVATDTSDGPVRGRLLVVADGGRSAVRDRLGFVAGGRPYPQRALVTIAGVDRPHRRRAYERFTAHGPLALLPMTEQRFAVAWTLPPEEAEELGAIDEAAFIERLQSAFGYRAGIFTRCGPRRVYPLDLSTVLEPVRHRACVVGNAAHIVHPVAGQGFNLGLRDVAELAETLAVAHARGEDPGQVAVLRRYARRRRIQTRLVSGFTDSLVTLFSHRSRAVVASRSAGLLAVGLMPPLKRFLLRRTMGLRGRAPWLATGLGLDLMPLDERDESR